MLSGMVGFGNFLLLGCMVGILLGCISCFDLGCMRVGIFVGLHEWWGFLLGCISCFRFHEKFCGSIVIFVGLH